MTQLEWNQAYNKFSLFTYDGWQQKVQQKPQKSNVPDQPPEDSIDENKNSERIFKETFAIRGNQVASLLDTPKQAGNEINDD